MWAYILLVIIIASLVYARKRIFNYGRFLRHFGEYVFDLHRDLNSGERFDVGAGYRLVPDRERLLHMVWHCAVYLPVFVVFIVGLVIGADAEDLLFFVAVAMATVSLEICIGIILSKARDLQELSRQTQRALDNHQIDGQELRGWIKYFMVRHRAGKEGLAKSAFVTAISLVLFGSIVGVEAVRMRAHSSEHTTEAMEDFLERNPPKKKDASHETSLSAAEKSTEKTSTPDKRPASSWLSAWFTSKPMPSKGSKERLMLDLGHNADPWTEPSALLTFAVIASGLLFAMANVKLWVQTRASLETEDAMDHFKRSADAIQAYNDDPVFHLSEHALHRRRAQQKNSKLILFEANDPDGLVCSVNDANVFTLDRIVNLQKAIYQLPRGVSSRSDDLAQPLLRIWNSASAKILVSVERTKDSSNELSPLEHQVCVLLLLINEYFSSKNHPDCLSQRLGRRKDSSVLFFSEPDAPHGELSLWHPFQFTLNEVVYKTLGHLIAAEKAKFFDDRDAASEILETEDVARVMEIGAKFKDCDELTWIRKLPAVALEGVKAKFTPDGQMREKLLNTGDLILIEFSPANFFGPKNGDGLLGKDNLLGSVLMECRDSIRLNSGSGQESS